MKTYHYEIQIEGALPASRSSWFDGMEISPGPDGSTMLAGPLPDQAALHGLLMKIRDLGLSLISIRRCERAERKNFF